MKNYEGVFIFNVANSDERLQEVIDEVSKEISNAGGTVGQVEKLEHRSFARIADKRFKSGFYTNIFFTLAPSELEPLRTKLVANEDVFRVLVRNVPNSKGTQESSNGGD